MERKKNTKPKKSPGTGPVQIQDTPSCDQPWKKPGTAALLLGVVLLGCAVLFGLYLLNTPPSSPPPGTEAPAVSVYYFYGTECLPCQNVTRYVESLRQKYPDVTFRLLEIWHDEANNALSKEMNQNLNQVQYSVPEVIVGTVVLTGESDITTNLEGVISDQKNNLTARATGTTPSITATYFYGNGCSHCENVKSLIAGIQARYPELLLEKLEINDNKTNREKFLSMRLQYGLGTSGSIPTIFIGEYVLVGETEIRNQFEAKILAEKQRIASGVVVTPANQTPGDAGSPAGAPALNPYMVIFAALADSANPCGLSVLVFLLISMAAAGDRKRILLVGGVYIAATFLFHLLVGIGLFSAIAISGLTKPFSIMGGIVALTLGIITLSDVLRNRETFLLSIPESGKGMLGTYARKATVPAAFVLGILAGILGFSCTGGIYISILGLMGRDMTVMAGLPYLVLYNLIYVLPLVLVTLLVAYGLSPERAERWRTENKRTIRVIIGLILVALGLVILLGWLG